GIYLPLEIEPDQLENGIKGLLALGFSGYNVTIPYKIKVMQYLDNITDEAQKLGAVNTVIINEDKSTTGDNTDIYGFIANLSTEDQLKLKNKKAAIIGAGGASRAVGAGLIKLGVNSINLYDINKDATKDTIAILSNFSDNSATLNGYDITKIDLNDIDILVNASPIGMYPKEDACPVTKETLEKLNTGSIVYDLIYKPLQTNLIKMAKDLNYTTYTGEEMLIQQGAKSFEKWTQKQPPIDEMRKSILEALK
ncbi:MAG: shikimate dehydrogenase, partial [Vampirovibrionia bacterium]